MPINSLRQFTGTAFTTARTTFKAMAEAAVPPSEPNVAPGDGPAPVAPVAAVRPSGDVLRGAERTLADNRKAGVRQGTSLDAYA